LVEMAVVILLIFIPELSTGLPHLLELDH